MAPSIEWVTILNDLRDGRSENDRYKIQGGVIFIAKKRGFRNKDRGILSVDQ